MIPLQQTLPEWAALAPTLLLGLAALVVFLIDSVRPNTEQRTLITGVSLVGALSASGVGAWYLLASLGQPGGLVAEPIELLSGALVVDGMSTFFTVVFSSVTALVVVASYDYVVDQPHQSEFYSLTLLAATGMTLMASANSLATVFVSLELASFPSYVLVSYLKKNRGSVEAGLKYFLIGALSSAIFAFGVSLIYAATGSLLLSEIATAFTDLGDLAGVAGVGVIMIAAGFAFKTASVPFHFWAPEAYEGAPAPISAFLSSASKAAGFAVAFRVFAEAFPLSASLAVGINWVLLFWILAVVTMTPGNFAAATQEEVKRMLAYSSVGHAGYALIGLAAITVDGANGDVMGASMAHLLVYGFMNTGAFLFVALVEHWGLGRTFEDYNGLGTKAPVASIAMTVFMFSLAGLPPFGGFLSKYALFMGAINNGFVVLAAIGAVNSALSLFYYSRVVKALWIEDPVDGLEITSRPVGLYVAVLVAALGTVLLLPGFGPVIESAQTAAAALFA